MKDEHVHEILFSEKCRHYAEVKHIRKCRDCELLNFCRGCRAVGYGATHDLQGEYPMCWKE